MQANYRRLPEAAAPDAGQRVEELSTQIAVLDRHGEIVTVNPAWERFALEQQTATGRCGVGMNYLQACRERGGPFADEAATALDGIQSVLDGSLPAFTLEYSCHWPTQERWFLLHVTPLLTAQGGAVVSHIDISDRKRVENAFRRAHEFSESLFNTAKTIVLVLDTAGRIVSFNPYLEELSGWRLAEVKGRDWFETFLPAEDRPWIQGVFESAVAGERTRGNVNTIVTRDGRQLEIEWFDAPLTSTDGELIGLLCTGQDVTQRKRAEAMLMSLGRILEESLNEIYIFDAESLRFVQVNRGARENLGYTMDELRGLTPLNLKPRYTAAEFAALLAPLRSGEKQWVRFETIHLRRDGSSYDVEVHVQFTTYQGAPSFVAIIRDTTERNELQRQVLEIAAEEDRRIGHELHDNTQQQLTGLGLLAQSLAETLAHRSIPEARLAARLAAGINESARHVHLLSRGLVPVEVDAQGLRSALTDLASTIGEQYAVQCRFDCHGPVDVADNYVATHLFRIAQEAVNNAIKHGRAERIEMSLTGTGENITLKVLDDGIGIGDKRSGGPGMGLRIMAYRASLIGAALQIAAGDERGTSVSCSVLHGKGD